MARIRKSLPDDIRRETKFFIEPFLNKEDGLLYYIDTRGFLIPLSQGDGSIYVADGTLLGDRTLTGAANFLHFADLSNFTVDTTGDINLDPGGEVAVGASRSISFDQAALGANVTAIECRSNPRTQIAFVASGPADTPNELWMNADTDVYLAPDSGNTIFNKNLAFYTASGGEIADIDTAAGKVLVTKDWVNTALSLDPTIYKGDSFLTSDRLITCGGNELTFGAGSGDLEKITFDLTGGVPALGQGFKLISDRVILLESTAVTAEIKLDSLGGIALTSDSSDITLENTTSGNIYIGTTSITGLTQIRSPFKYTGSTPGVGKLLESDVAGNAQWVTPSFAGSSIYTNSGTVPTTTVATITDTLNFNGGKVGINVAPATNDFEVNGDTLLKTLTIGTTGQYGFPLNATISNDTQVLKYNHATNALIFSNETNTNIYTHDGTVGSTRTAIITDTLQFIGGQVDVTAGTTDTGVTVLSSEKADMSNIVEFNDRAQGRVNSSAYITCAQFEVASDTRGFLPPRNVDPVTNILGPVEGLIAWDSTDNELQVFDGSDWITLGDLNNPKRTWNWGAARNHFNVTNQYIRTFNGTPNQLCPYVVPFDCILTDLTCSTRDNETWVAEVREDPRPGGTETVIASISVSSANQGSTNGLSVALSAGDEIGFYCNGTGISYPHIQAWFKET